MASFLSILLIAVGIIIALILIGFLGWICKGLMALIGFSWEGVIGCIGCFIRFWIYIFIIAFVIAVISKMVS